MTEELILLSVHSSVLVSVEELEELLTSGESRDRSTVPGWISVSTVVMDDVY